MVRTITVDGKEVTFRASAAIPRMYRMKFRRDIMQDMREIDQATRGRSIPPRLLEAFENMAFLMAKHADPKGVPDTVEAWLDGFETFSIYEIFPIIAELWAVHMEPVAASKKELTTALFLLRVAQLGIPIRDLELLSIGMVSDMFTEACNDQCSYHEIATQEDFDAF